MRWSACRATDRRPACTSKPTARFWASCPPASRSRQRCSPCLFRPTPGRRACSSGFPIGIGGDFDSRRVGCSREAELARELARIEYIRRVVLIEHLVEFAYEGIEPPTHLDHAAVQGP